MFEVVHPPCNSLIHTNFTTKYLHSVKVKVKQSVYRPGNLTADRLRAGSGLNLYDIYHCCVYSEKLLMMDRGTVRNT